MRKHFLLLFLMALLPLAGWADTDVSSATFTLGSTTLQYVGHATKPAITSATVGDTPLSSSDYTLKFYDANDNVVTNLINVGSYKVSLVSGTYESTMKVAFEIVKVPMTISLKDVTKVYGADDPVATDFEYTVTSGFVGEDDQNSVVVTVNIASATRETGENKGDYNYSGITASADNYTVTVSNQPKLTITPATLTVSHEVIVKNFGEPNPALNIDDFTITGWTGNEITGTTEEQTNKKAAAINFASASYTQNEKNANCDKDGDFLSGITAGYQCNVTGLTTNTENYTLSFAGVTMKIKQIELKDANTFTFTMENANKTYDGTVQKPDYTIVYKATNYELKASDFTVTYAENSGVSKKAGTYTATVSAVANGNFYATAFAKTAFNFTIAQKNLYVQAKSDTKVYDGNPFTLSGKAATDYEFNGIADADDAYTLAVTTGSVEYVSTTLTDAQKKSVGSYDVKPVLTTWTLKDGEDNDWAANYKVVALSTGKYSITARPLTITAKDKSIDYGQPAPSFTNTTDFIYIETAGGKKVDGTTNVATDEGAINATEATAILAQLTVGLNQEYTDADTYTKAIVVALAENQELTNYNAKFVAGDYTIKGATYTIIANNITKVYGQDYALSYTNTGAEPAVAVEYAVYLNGVRVEGDHPTDAGTYDIKIIQNAAYKPSANYSTIDYVDGKLKITPKTLTVTPQAVTLNYNATADDLNSYGTVDYNGLEEGDEIEYTLAFNTTGANGVTVNEGKLQTEVGQTKTQGVGITFPAAANVQDGYANNNYTINAVAQYGAITVIAENSLILAFNDVNIGDKIAAAATKERKVVFGAKTMVANEWYPMVLPFATSAYDLVDKLGQYVVLNTYSTTSTPNHISFKLEMGDIPAGKPFLIKAGAALNWNEKDFGIKTIVANPVAQGTLENNGSIFTGVFSYGNVLLNGYELDGETADATLAYQWLSNRTDTEGWGTIGNYWRAASANDHHKRNLSPLEAFLQLPAGATSARITVEDFDGQTTSIKTLSTGDMKAVVADGWYTIDGIKLQSAPTQKGIYINNGKKIVVK